MDIRTCSFSGHREILRIHEGELCALLSKTIDELIAAGVRRFCSGGAVGFDLLAARIVLEKKLRGADVSLSMILPCPDQAKGWSFGDKTIHSGILHLADEIIYTSDHYHRFCMSIRNQRLVDEADVLVCYLAKKTGGTANTVRYANARQKRIINLCDLFADGRTEE